MSTESFIVIGRIGKPRGLRGSFFVNPLTNVIGRFENLEEIVVENDNGLTKRYDVESSVWQGKHVVMKLTGVDDRDAADELRGCFVSISHAQVPDLPEDVFYSYELIGCTVQTVDGETIGKILDVEEYPANDVLKIGSDEEYILVPAVKAIVVDVNLERRLVVVDPPEDLPAYPVK